MGNKEYQVIKFLEEQQHWSTAAQISSALKCSARSIKTYIANINSDYPNFILSSREGFKISDRSCLPAILNELSVSPIPQTPEKRKAYILKALLIEHQALNLDVLADELYISPITLMNEISKIKLDLIDFDLVFRTKNNVAYIDGLEKNKKKMISHLIYEETKDYFSNLDMVQDYFIRFDLKMIRKIVIDALLANHYFIDDFSLINFIFHIGITLERSILRPTDRYELYESTAPVMINPHITLILNEICKQINHQFSYKFTDNEVYDLSLILMTRIVSKDVTHMESSRLTAILSPEIWALTDTIQKMVRETFYVNLNNQDFIIRFSLHLKNLLIRLENGIDLRNPQFSSIKNTYPYIYDVSVFIANIITQKKGFLLTEDEISYIALHLGVLIEEQKALRDKIKVVVLCPQYYSSHLKLVKKINAIFEESLIITGIITFQDDLATCSDYDFIISTVPLQKSDGKPYIHSSGYLDNKDIGNIVTMIEDIKKARVRSTLENKLKYMFKKELFFYNPSFTDEKDAINEMSDSLHMAGCVELIFKEKLFEREAISSSAYQNVAMPHPLEMHARETAIAVSIHPKGINWNGTTVNIVFMLAINEEDRILFKDIFDFVTEIIFNKKYFQNIMCTKTYDEFIKLLVSYV